MTFSTTEINWDWNKINWNILWLFKLFWLLQRSLKISTSCYISCVIECKISGHFWSEKQVLRLHIRPVSLWQQEMEEDETSNLEIAACHIYTALVINGNTVATWTEILKYTGINPAPVSPHSPHTLTYIHG